MILSVVVFHVYEFILIFDATVVAAVAVRNFSST